MQFKDSFLKMYSDTRKSCCCHFSELVEGGEESLSGGDREILQVLWRDPPSDLVIDRLICI